MAKDSGLGWDVEALNKAYRQGAMAGSMRMDKSRCPYRGDVVIAAWEAGWDDAQAAVEAQKQQQTDSLFARIA